jgi:L-rhamnose mutarotase
MAAMKRIGIFFKLKPGKKAEYCKRHAEIWPEMTEVLDMAGFRNYSIFSEGDMLFAYYEIKDIERAGKILAQSEVYARWRDEMEEFVFIDENGQKEWLMKQVFYHE